ncbi:hypothetical protein D0T12_14890 [Actinomadura spongiicola]|uniref:Cysteinyl-tRNA synthetase n=1 Tax=Actinomadura spongiicola TaxID=2303421 RepID=A0A372GHE3_9ACTN|nr:hypothetical protein [Actinomadura spongiicola]RFS84804.1 hypothetical protein D0T12_14890 [Actinomadura spongiicola]
MLRVFDHRTGRPEPLPAGPGLRVQVVDAAGRRVPVVADLLRRVAQRAGRRVRVACVPPCADEGRAEYNVAPFEVLAAPMPDADLYVSETRSDGWCLTVPRETGDWTSVDPLTARLAMLEVPYREPLEASENRLSRAARRLDGWRGQVAEWATAPGRPMSRAHATEAEAALADDLDAPAALAVLDRLAGDPDVPPGAKLETFIHLDLLLAIGLVSAIGSA